MGLGGYLPKSISKQRIRHRALSPEFSLLALHVFWILHGIQVGIGN